MHIKNTFQTTHPHQHCVIVSSQYISGTYVTSEQINKPCISRTNYVTRPIWVTYNPVTRSCCHFQTKFSARQKATSFTDNYTRDGHKWMDAKWKAIIALFTSGNTSFSHTDYCTHLPLYHTRWRGVPKVVTQEVMFASYRTHRNKSRILCTETKNALHKIKPSIMSARWVTS